MELIAQTFISFVSMLTVTEKIIVVPLNSLTYSNPLYKSQMDNTFHFSKLFSQNFSSLAIVT